MYVVKTCNVTPCWVNVDVAKAALALGRVGCTALPACLGPDMGESSGGRGVEGDASGSLMPRGDCRRRIVLSKRLMARVH